MTYAPFIAAARSRPLRIVARTVGLMLAFIFGLAGILMCVGLYAEIIAP